jgi:hypothetical protein
MNRMGPKSVVRLAAWIMVALWGVALAGLGPCGLSSLLGDDKVNQKQDEKPSQKKDDKEDGKQIIRVFPGLEMTLDEYRMLQLETRRQTDAGRRISLHEAHVFQWMLINRVMPSLAKGVSVAYSGELPRRRVRWAPLSRPKNAVF